jgi:Protein of unknown function (DUF3631)
VWEPLLAIADLAGGPWPGWSRSAAIALHQAHADQHDTIRLLSDLRSIFDGHKALSTKDVIRALVDIEDAPYAIWWARQVADADANPDKSPGLWQSLGAKLSRELKEFEVKPRKAYDGERKFKGYERADLEPLWERYLPAPVGTPSELGELRELGESPGQVPADSPTSTSSPSFAHIPTEPEACSDCGWKWFHGHAEDCPRRVV